MILEKNSKVLVVHRRLFESDEPRMLVGVVDEFDGTLARITGHTWFRSPLDDVPIQKEGIRTKIVAIPSGTLLVYALPDELDLNSARFEPTQDGRLLFRADPGFELDVSESRLRRIDRRVA